MLTRRCGPGHCLISTMAPHRRSRHQQQRLLGGCLGRLAAGRGLGTAPPRPAHIIMQMSAPATPGPAGWCPACVGAVPGGVQELHTPDPGCLLGCPPSHQCGWWLGLDRGGHWLGEAGLVAGPRTSPAQSGPGSPRNPAPRRHCSTQS